MNLSVISRITAARSPLSRGVSICKSSKEFGWIIEPEKTVELLQSLLPKLKDRSATENNLLAYTRSILGLGLDQALVEIDAALIAEKFATAELLDTKAWVLFQRKEYENALVFANSSVDAWYRRIKQSAPSIVPLLLDDASLNTLREAGEEFESQFQKKNAFSRDASWKGMLKTIATIRHHRASILKALELEDEAKLDLLWLKIFGFDNPSELF